MLLPSLYATATLISIARLCFSHFPNISFLFNLLLAFIASQDAPFNYTENNYAENERSQFKCNQ